MVKKEVLNHPASKHPRTLGQKAADAITGFAGSWTFIFIFGVFLVIWISINTYFFVQSQLGNSFDPYPFVFLNLILSTMAAIQAPVILMSQNREAQRDRIRGEYDYAVNKKAEREIEEIKDQLKRIEKKLKI